MSEAIKSIIGDELYNQIIAKGVKPNEFDLTKNYIPKGRFDEINNKFKATEEKNTTFEKQIAEMQGIVSGSEDLKKQLGELTTKYTTELATKDKEISNVTKKTLVREKLITMGATGKRVDMLLKEINLDTLSVENNNLLGFDAQGDNLKTEFDFMFNTTQQKPTNDTTPPASHGNKQTGENVFLQFL